MKTRRNAGFGLAAGILFLAAAGAGSPMTISLDLGPAPRLEPDLPAIVRSLEAWLDRDGSYPPSPEPATVEIVDRGVATTGLGVSDRPGMILRGLYDAETATIYLLAPWSADDDRDVSVLLHELVHHRQHRARHWYCPGAQEPDAYRLQAEWLAERGLRLKANHIAVALEAGCTPRDFHPD